MSGIMARTVYVLMGLLGGSVTFAATLNNTDSLEHVLRIQKYGEGPTVLQILWGDVRRQPVQPIQSGRALPGGSLHLWMCNDYAHHRPDSRCQPG